MILLIGKTLLKQAPVHGIRIKETLKVWKDNDDKMFINTRAVQCVLKCIQENGCVTITDSFGVGKTTTLRHIALLMADEGYDVILVTKPSEIVRFYNPNTKSLFVVDDLCGNFSIDQSDIKSWEPIMQDLNQIIDINQSKILAACRLQVYQDEKFDSLSVFKSCVCNMLSDSMCLSKTEKNAMYMLYLKAKPSVIDYRYDCFPLLCKLCHENSELDAPDFFRNPFSVYEAEIDKLFKKGLYAKYCALALCVVFNNKLNVDLFIEDIDEMTKTIIWNTCEACKLDRGTSRLVLQSELDLLTHTFIQKEHNVYKTINNKIFDFLAYYFGQKILYCLIKNADIGLIKERFLLGRSDIVNQFIAVIPLKYHQIYIKRMIDDWSKGKVQGVFNNINMYIPLFRNTFLSFLKTLNISYQKQLANTFDKCQPCTHTSIMQFSNDDTYDTPLLHCCYIGDIALVNWCCSQGVDENRCSFNGKSPIMVGFERGHTELVKMLLERRADWNKCDKREESILMMAFEHGHTDMVKMLLERRADWKKCDKREESLLMMAFEHGHRDMVKMLLDRGVDYNICDMFGESFVMQSCKYGDNKKLSVFLKKGADLNECDGQNKSLLAIACEGDHIEIVNMLLKRANYNKRDRYDESCVMKSC
ncbi:Hypothetical predicted protein [Mytilus galloprovincialis]|uniref:Novel STAND NTPase 3 domain-containing protein n=1 Tax=Mytilus galloprovincialis TaxID=29158 RepID=A0A8B6HRR4_MYTGA|nr:Hypothetical predicted protein [Mytilus galloprovincialis]